MNFLPYHALVEDPRGTLPRWVCALGVLHAVVCATGLTLHLL
ncbi:MAG TPA: hypothetical protein VGD97_08305 [Lacunisphaera sp.]